MYKNILEVNLESGLPTVEAAVQKLKNALISHKRQGHKAVIVIHGYGSSGAGGSIKPAVLRCLGESSMRGIVRAYAGGDEWAARKREMTGMCKALENCDGRVANNPGVTVVILRQ